jgi:cytochrome c-type biogenesis protein CcmH
MSGESAPQQVDARVKAVAEQLRCVVCQNQTIAESHAELALDLRAQIREQVVQGRRDEQILAYMAERYGAYVLYKPPVNAATALLWGGPAAMLLGGALAMALAIRRRGRSPAAQPNDEVAAS